MIMADFTTSTHRISWIFTPQNIKERYKAANQRAKQVLEKFGSTRVEVSLDGSTSYVQNPKDATGENHSRAKPLRVEEEQSLRAFYEFKIQDVCDAFKFPRKIQSFAGYRSHLLQKILSAMVCDGTSPKGHHVRFSLPPKQNLQRLLAKYKLLTCIYTACKAEENHVSAEELGKGIEQDHQVILNNEMLVLQSLGFDLIVYAPYRALQGFINDIQEYTGAGDDQTEMLEKLHESGKAEVDWIMRTDAPLLFPPGQLALAALRRSNVRHGFFEFDRYLKNILSHQSHMPSDSDLIVSLNAVDSLISKLETPLSKEVKHIDRKLKSCLDPGSSHDNSKKRKHRSKEGSNDVDMS